jgi:hypothetical protein
MHAANLAAGLMLERYVDGVSAECADCVSIRVLRSEDGDRHLLPRNAADTATRSSERHLLNGANGASHDHDAGAACAS